VTQPNDPSPLPRPGVAAPAPPPLPRREVAAPAPPPPPQPAAAVAAPPLPAVPVPAEPKARLWRRRPGVTIAAPPPAPSSPVAPAPPVEGRADRRSRWRTVARVAAWVTAIAAVAVVLLVFVFPTRTYLAQRRQLADAANQLHLLDTQNAALATQVARLQTDAEIERIAREQYHLVRPGESAIAILPAPSPPAPATPAPPHPKPHRGWLQRLTSWIP
jgi:cell division protein FtsB